MTPKLELVQCSLLPYLLGFWMPSPGTADTVLQLLPWSSECVHVQLSWCTSLQNLCFSSRRWSSCGALSLLRVHVPVFVLVACAFVVYFHMLSSGRGMAVVLLKSHHRKPSEGRGHLTSLMGRSTWQLT